MRFPHNFKYNSLTSHQHTLMFDPDRVLGRDNLIRSPTVFDAVALVEAPYLGLVV